MRQKAKPEEGDGDWFMLRTLPLYSTRSSRDPRQTFSQRSHWWCTYQARKGLIIMQRWEKTFYN